MIISNVMLFAIISPKKKKKGINQGGKKVKKVLSFFRRCRGEREDFAKASSCFAGERGPNISNKALLVLVGGERGTFRCYSGRPTRLPEGRRSCPGDRHSIQARAAGEKVVTRGAKAFRPDGGAGSTQKTIHRKVLRGKSVFSQELRKRKRTKQRRTDLLYGRKVGESRTYPRRKKKKQGTCSSSRLPLCYGRGPASAVQEEKMWGNLRRITSPVVKRKGTGRRWTGIPKKGGKEEGIVCRSCKSFRARQKGQKGPPTACLQSHICQ